jgi:hypothetical protein
MRSHASWLMVALLIGACHSKNVGYVPQETRDMAARIRAAIAAAQLDAEVSVVDADSIHVQSATKLLRIDMVHVRAPCATSAEACDEALAKITTALTKAP